MTIDLLKAPEEPRNGLYDSDVLAMAAECIKARTLPPPEWLARLDARQARLFKRTMPKPKARRR